MVSASVRLCAPHQNRLARTIKGAGSKCLAPRHAFLYTGLLLSYLQIISNFLTKQTSEKWLVKWSTKLSEVSFQIGRLLIMLSSLLS